MFKLLSYVHQCCWKAWLASSQQTRVFILLWLIMPDCLHRRLPSQAVHDQCQICQKSGGSRGSTKLESVGLGPPDDRHTTFSMSDGTRDRGEGGSFSSRRWSPLSIEVSPPPLSSSPCVDVWPLSNTFSLVYNGSYIVFTGWGHFPMSTPLATPL